jgi:twitching motility two-component system response regulator PilG
MTKVPIIMLTSKTSPADEVKGLMAGCTTYLTKPFVHEEFQKMLKRITRWVKEFNDRK